MTYSPITPQSQPSPKDTQLQIQTNFAQFATIFAQNHTALNNSNQGKHEKVILENLPADPGVINDLVSLYNKNATSKSGIQPQLFAQILKFLPTPNDSRDVPNTGMQLTQSVVNTTGPNQYQSFLPGNYMLYFGTVTTAPATVTLIPAPTTILCAIAIPNNLSSPATPTPFSASTNVTSNSTFDIISDSTGVFTIMWVAIATA